MPHPALPHPPTPTHPQIDDTDVVNFLLQTEIIPLCLRIMETGSELSKTVATFIVQKVGGGGEGGLSGTHTRRSASLAGRGPCGRCGAV